MIKVIRRSSYFLFIIIGITLLRCGKEKSPVSDTILTEDEDTLEESLYNNMFTPAYYLSSTSASFKNEVNQFVNTVQNIQFSHPLKGLNTDAPSFVVKSIFGSTKGIGSATQYHPAADVYVGNKETNVNLYAAYDGYISIARDVDKYRNYIAITKEIKDDNNVVIGKLVTLYAHIDLDLDASEFLFEEGDFISEGTLISKHLYAETVGGPHLHFEVRYYRANDVGNEEFYGGFGSDLTQASEGNWQYGYWNPAVGYGYANAKNHQLFLY